MALQITSDTVVKVLIRRGQESDRQLTLLSQGELGYSVDTRRVFVGDGVTLGGYPVSNLFQGFVANRNDPTVTSVVQSGDLIFQNNNATLYAYDGLSDAWIDIHPYFGTNSFEQNGQYWDMRRAAFSPAFGYDPSQPNPGSYILNTSLPTPKYSISGKPGIVDFNSRFLSLCASAIVNSPGTLSGSMYFGNIHNRTVKNNFNATVNVDNSLYLNGTASNPNQIMFEAVNSRGNSSIKSLSGKFDIQGYDIIDFYSRNWKTLELNSANNFVFTPYSVGNYTLPNFTVNGVSRFYNDVYFDGNATLNQNLYVNGDSTIVGNLSVLGNLGYFESNVVSTSALSVIAFNDNLVALEVSHVSTDASDMIIARFDSYKSNQISRPVMTIRDGPFVGINVSPNTNWTRSNAALILSGSTAFGQDPVRGGVDFFTVDTGSGGITLNACGEGGAGPHAGPLLSKVSSMTFTTVGNNANFGEQGDLTFALSGGANFNLTKTVNYAENQFVNVQTNVTNTPLIALNVNSGVSDTRSFYVVPDSSSASYNPIIASRDTALIYGGPAISQATGFSIAPWHSVLHGIRMDGSGNVAIGKQTPTAGILLDVNGNASINGNMTLSGNFGIGSNLKVAGTIYCTGDIIAFYTSDKTLKKDIKVIDSALEKIDKINGVTFTWDEEKQSDYSGVEAGVIAQEVEAILPEAVTTRSDGTKAVKYDSLIPLLIQAIKELKQQINK